MQNEISFSTLLRTLKHCWWKVVIIALVAMVLMASFTIFFIPKKYSSTMEIYIINTNAQVDYTSSSLLAAAEYLVNDYVSIIKGDAMLDKLIAELKEEGYTGLSHQKLRSMIKTSAADNSSVFKLSVEHTDPKLAYAVAKKIAEMAPGEITKVAKSDINNRLAIAKIIYRATDYFENAGRETGTSPYDLTEILAFLEKNNLGLAQQDCIAINIQPKEPTTHDSPNLVMNTLVAGVAAAALAYVVYLILAISRSVITTEEDVKASFDYPVIGAIPHWSNHIGKNAKGGYYYGKN